MAAVFYTAAGPPRQGVRPAGAKGAEMLIPLLNPGRAKMALLNPSRTPPGGAFFGPLALIIPLLYGVYAGVYLFSGGFECVWLSVYKTAGPPLS